MPLLLILFLSWLFPLLLLLLALLLLLLLELLLQLQQERGPAASQVSNCWIMNERF